LLAAAYSGSAEMVLWSKVSTPAGFSSVIGAMRSP
jgi:hypothetical protein